MRKKFCFIVEYMFGIWYGKSADTANFSTGGRMRMERKHSMAAEAQALLAEYRRGKAALDARVVDNDQ